MKKILLAAVVVALAGPAFAQTGQTSGSSNRNCTNCGPSTSTNSGK